MVVVLPDSIRSYLSKFVDDDWLAANDLLPPTPAASAPGSPSMRATTAPKDAFAGATVGTLRLKPVTTVLSDSPCEEAVETMREKGFDQLPVKSAKGNRLVGLVTLGNLLSRIGSGSATGSSPVSSVMFDFSKLSSLSCSNNDLYKPPSKGEMREKMMISEGIGESKPKRREFIEITKETPLGALSRFFEWNSAAVVTERNEQGEIKPIAVVTKVDLLSYLVKHSKI